MYHKVSRSHMHIDTSCKYQLTSSLTSLPESSLHKFNVINGNIPTHMNCAPLIIQAMAKRKDLEDKKNREYRLTAFTGDLPLGSY